MPVRQTALQRLRAHPRAAAGAGAAFLALAVLLGLNLGRHGDGAGILQSERLEPRPFAVDLSVVGAIAPGDSVDIAAPFEGTVKSVAFAYGDHVAEGQILAALDTTDLRQRHAEALAAALKAGQAAAEMHAWSTGPDVSRAERAVATAALELDSTRRKTRETKMLLDRGLVAREEYDGLLLQEHNEEMGLAAARQDLRVTLAQGRGPNRQVTELELAGARAQLAAYDAELAGAAVRAPAGGVIVRPPSDKAGAEGDAGGGVHVGQQLSRGQLIGQVARPGGLAVTFRLGETDADQVRPGQAVTVTGPGFGGLEVRGRVLSVAGVTSPSPAGAGPLASFAAMARLDPLTQAQAAAIRIGMTANVTIELYSAANALVAPPGAIDGSGAAASVKVRRGFGRVVEVPVRLGRVAPDGVEILSGLEPGDVIVWRAPAGPGS